MMIEIGEISITVGNQDGSFCGENNIKITKEFKNYEEAEQFCDKIKRLIEKNMPYLIETELVH